MRRAAARAATRRGSSTRMRLSLGPGLVLQHQRHQRGLAGARRGHQHGIGRGAQGCGQGGQGLGDRKVGDRCRAPSRASPAQTESLGRVKTFANRRRSEARRAEAAPARGGAIRDGRRRAHRLAVGPHAPPSPVARRPRGAMNRCVDLALASRHRDGCDNDTTPSIGSRTRCATSSALPSRLPASQRPPRARSNPRSKQARPSSSSTCRPPCGGASATRPSSRSRARRCAACSRASRPAAGSGSWPMGIAAPGNAATSRCCSNPARWTPPRPARRWTA